MYGACSSYGGEVRDEGYPGFGGETDHFGRPRRRWEYNIKMALKWDVGVWAKSSWLKIGGGHL